MADQEQEAKSDPQGKAQSEAAPVEAGPPAADAPADTAPETEPVSLPAPPLPEGQHYLWGTGRRKKAVARVRIRPGSGEFHINKRPSDKYFTQDRDRSSILEPLQAIGMLKSWDIWVNVRGGGYTGQAGAVVLGLARALARAVPDLEHTLRGHNLMTRDARMKERKKYGQKGARKRFQFSKR